MSDSFTLPLRPNLERQDRPDTLPVEIAQINNQWGSFRDVNEEILQTKIREENERNGAQTPEVEDEDGEVDTTERLELLYKKRAEITQFAVQSHMEAMFALDFVSLLLSKSSPRQAETSMSAFLKQVAPLGSLDSEVVNPLPKSESATKDVSRVSKGWRTQNFNSASSKLLKAATRLENEVTSETKYWNEVLAVKDKGWKICRLPRERQALGVQYGFLEATPAFRDRGLASLRRSQDGSLVLDKGLIPSRARYVRVQVRQGSRIASSSRPALAASHDPESIEHRILQARDSVFEEELFHELVREARSMASSGVTTRQNLIQIPASGDTEILLDLVDADDENIDSEQGDSATATDKLLADGLAHSIRILLTFAHRQNLHRRTQSPPPLTSKKRTTPEYHLLRPALAYFQHHIQLRSLESFLKDIFAVLRASGLDVPELDTKTFVNSALQFPPTSLASVEAFIQKLLVPIESVFRGKLVTAHSSFKVTIRTNLSAPPFGTIYDVSFDFPSVDDLKSPGRVTTKEEVEAAVTHILLLDILSQITSKSLADQSSPDGSKSWEAIYPHHGELRLSGSNDPMAHRKMKVALSRRELTVSTYLVRSVDGIGRGLKELASQSSEPNTWTSLSEGNANQSSMMDFVVAESS